MTLNQLIYSHPTLDRHLSQPQPSGRVDPARPVSILPLKVHSQTSCLLSDVSATPETPKQHIRAREACG